MEPLVIGNSQKPRCFRGINLNNLPVSYNWSKKAWMTQNIFYHWIKNLDTKFRRQNRKVLMLLDNASSHIKNDVNVNN